MAFWTCFLIGGVINYIRVGAIFENVLSRDPNALPHKTQGLLGAFFAGGIFYGGGLFALYWLIK
jgi:hypothetical protein